MQAIVHAADIQDRDGGVLLMGTLFGLYPVPAEALRRQRLSGAEVPAGTAEASAGRSTSRSSSARTAGKFVVLPKRWIVERTIGWLNRCRRLAKDWECLNRNASRVPALGVHPPHAPKAMSNHTMIPDGLLAQLRGFAWSAMVKWLM